VTGAVAFFAIAGLFMYSPISWNMGSLVTDRWDGLLHTWILAWDVHKFTTGLSGFWDANIFWPHPNALAYSDHLLGSAVVAAPFLWITSNPIFAHNAVTYLSFVLSGLGMFLLVRRLAGDAFAGLVAGVIFAYCPWRYGQMGHETQLLADQWLPFTLLFLHRTIEDRRVSDGLLTGLFFGLNALTSFYLAAIGAVAAGTVFAVELVVARGIFSKRTWAGLVLGGLVSLAMVAPTIMPYYEVRQSQGLQRSVRESESMSADPLDYFRAPPWNRLWGRITGPLENRYSPFPNENRLFVGVSVLFLALFGLLAVPPSKWAKHQKVYLSVAAAAFVFSLGPYLHLFYRRLPVPLPYLAAYKFVPGFGGLRVPARFALGVELGAAVMAAYGFLRLARRWEKKRWRACAGILAVSLVLIEFYSSPLPTHEIPAGEKIPEVYKWLSGRDVKAPMVELPQHYSIPALSDWVLLHKEPLGFRYMYYSTYHWNKMVNGWSGFLPPTSRRIYEFLAGPPDAKTVNLLRYLGVELVVLHADGYEWLDKPDPEEIIRNAGELMRQAARFGTDVVYEVPDPWTWAERENGDRIEMEKAVFPKGVPPGSPFNVEICLSSTDDMPFYSFGLTKFDISAELAQGEVRRRQRKEMKNFLMIDPGGKQWIAATLTAPARKGRYRGKFRISLPEFGVSRDFRFGLEVGEFFTSDAPGVLRGVFTRLEIPEKVKTGEVFTITARVRNEGDTLWRAYRYNNQPSDRGVVKLAVKSWRKSGDKVKIFDGHPHAGKGSLPRSVGPGDKVTVSVVVTAPGEPGKYELNIQMVDEHTEWFENSGGERLIVPIEVVAP